VCRGAGKVAGEGVGRVLRPGVDPEPYDLDCGACAGTGISTGECPKCHGTGEIGRDERVGGIDGLGATYVRDVVVPCECARLRRVRAQLGPLFADVPKIDRSAFWSREEPGRTAILAASNLWITAEWDDLAPHLKGALGLLCYMRPSTFNFRLVTDEDVRLSFVEGGQGSTEVGIRELVGPADYDLLILRLGFVSYKNNALPGAVLTAIRHREAMRRPTWVLDTPSHPMATGHLAYSADLVKHLTAGYRRVRVGGAS
jgi:hypothetical protein